MLDFAIFAVTFLLALVGAVLYLYPASRQAAGIPGIAPTEEKDGNLPDILTSGSLHEFLVHLHERCGPVGSFWFGRRLVVSLGTVEVLKQHINPNRMSNPFGTMLKSLLSHWPGGGTMDEHHLRERLCDRGVTEALHKNFQLLLKVWSEIGKGFLDGSLDKSATRKKPYEDALGQLESILKKIIKERKEKSFSQHTFIDSLVQGNLNDQQILEDSMIFSLAGCIITAKLCTWTIYFLTTSEEVQKKLYEEIDQVLGKSPLTPEKIEQLRFDPDRFDDDSVMKTFSSLGFSGTQECPELRFAYMAATVLLSVLVRRLCLLPVMGQVVETKYELVTATREEVWITVSKRT